MSSFQMLMPGNVVFSLQAEFPLPPPPVIAMTPSPPLPPLSPANTYTIIPTQTISLITHHQESDTACIISSWFALSSFCIGCADWRLRASADNVCAEPLLSWSLRSISSLPISPPFLSLNCRFHHFRDKKVRILEWQKIKVTPGSRQWH